MASNAGNPKCQSPNPKEIPKTKLQIPKRIVRALPFDYWNLKLPWDLVLGIWDFRGCRNAAAVTVIA
jgi:hypothetical protein